MGLLIDKEKVIKGLKCAIGIRGRKNCDDCPYDNDFNCIGCDIVMRDALELLKEQKPVIEALKCDLNETLAVLGKQPDIVRCNECKYCEYPNAEKEWCKKGHLHGNAKNWFCADGERR